MKNGRKLFNFVYDDFVSLFASKIDSLHRNLFVDFYVYVAAPIHAVHRRDLSLTYMHIESETEMIKLLVIRHVYSCQRLFCFWSIPHSLFKFYNKNAIEARVLNIFSMTQRHKALPSLGQKYTNSFVQNKFERNFLIWFTCSKREHKLVICSTIKAIIIKS